MINYKEIEGKDVAELFEKEKGFRTNIKCPDCENGVMVVRVGTSKFLGCSNYPKCKCTLSRPSIPHPSVIRSLLNKQAFRGNEIDGESWGDHSNDMFPNGIHCKDDM